MSDLDFKYRLDLEHYEFIELKLILNKIKRKNKTIISLNDKIEKVKKIKKSSQKTVSAWTATEKRTATAKKNILLAIDYIKRNDIKLTQSAVAKYSKCSINTVRKYKNLFE